MQNDYGQWWLAALNILLFGYFIGEAFKPVTKVDWRSFQMIMAFIIALFLEMYGFPLTIFLLTSVFGGRLPGVDFTHNSGHLLSDFLGFRGDPHFSPPHILSYILVIGGIILLGKAWKILYKSARKHVLAKSGPYAYIRHPQYLAFILIIIGFLLQWPTLITLFMAPILIWQYLRLGGQEDRQMLAQFGNEYRTYQRQTPGYIPKITPLVAAFVKRLISG